MRASIVWYGRKAHQPTAVLLLCCLLLLLAVVVVVVVGVCVLSRLPRLFAVLPIASHGHYVSHLMPPISGVVLCRPFGLQQSVCVLSLLVLSLSGGPTRIARLLLLSGIRICRERGHMSPPLAASRRYDRRV